MKTIQLSMNIYIKFLKGETGDCLTEINEWHQIIRQQVQDTVNKLHAYLSQGGELPFRIGNRVIHEFELGDNSNSLLLHDVHTTETILIGEPRFILLYQIVTSTEQLSEDYIPIGQVSLDEPLINLDFSYIPYDETIPLANGALAGNIKVLPNATKIINK